MEGLNYFSITGGVNALTSGILAGLILSRRKVSEAARAFGLYCLCICGWSLFYMLWHLTDNARLALVYNRIMMVPVVFLPSFFFHFSAALTGNRDRYLNMIKFSYVLSLLHALTIPSNYFIVRLAPVVARFWPVAGIFYTTHILMFGALLGLSAFLIWRTYLKSTGMFREQMKYSFLALAIGFGGGLTNYIPCYGFSIPPYGNPLVSVYVCILAYSIMAHRLFDLNLTFRNMLVRGMFTFLIGSPILFLLWVLPTTSLRIFLVLATIFMIPIFFRRMEERLEGFVDLWKPFRGRYLSYRETQQCLSFLSDCQNVEDWAKRLILAAQRLTGAHTVAVLMRDESMKRFLIKSGHGLNEAQSLMLSLPFSNPLVQHFEAVHELFTLDSLESVFQDETKRVQVKGDMEFIQAELCVPLYDQNVLKTILVLGNKEFGRIYNDLDLLYVDRLARQGEQASHSLTYGVDKERLTVAWAHDLRRPFSSKGSFARLVDMVQGKMGPVNETMKAVLSTAVSDAEFIASHLESVISPTNREQFKMTTGSMTAVYSNIRQKYQSIMDSQGIRWVVHIPEESVLMLRDPSVIEHRVLANFVENAARYTPSKGMVEVGFQIKNGLFVGYARDTGPGIKSEDLGSLFKPGAQLNGNSRGLAGLGLFSAKSVIEAHQGKVWVESQLGKGSTFYFQIPLLQNQG